jgi:hypothetical protein
MKRKKLSQVICKLLTLFLLLETLTYCSSNQGTWYLWTTHRDERDGLHYFISADGMNWQNVKGDSSVFTPDKYILRDPCIAKDRSGTYHLVWTTAWDAGETKTIGYSSSRDLIHWEKAKYIPVMENEPETENVWAPEIFFDEQNSDWIITWSSTVRGKFQSTAHIYGDRSNGRIYYRRTKDFENFTPSSLLFDVNIIAIDQTICRYKNSLYYIFYKADKDTSSTPGVKKLERGIMYVRGNSPTGPFTAGEGIIDRYFEKNENGFIEGPTLIKKGTEVIMYYGAEEHSGAFMTTDMKNWERITDRMQAPPNYMHGTVIPITEKEAKRLLDL